MSAEPPHMGEDVRNVRHETVPFPAELTGYIIGAGGNGIRSLRDRSGVQRAWVDDHAVTQFRRRFSVMHFIGNEYNVNAAKLHLMMRITDAMQNQVGDPSVSRQSPLGTPNGRARGRDEELSRA